MPAENLSLSCSDAGKAAMTPDLILRQDNVADTSQAAGRQTQREI